MSTVIMLFIYRWINITISNCTYVVISDIELFFSLFIEFIAHIYYSCRFFKLYGALYNVLFVHFPPYLQDRMVYPLD